MLVCPSSRGCSVPLWNGDLGWGYVPRLGTRPSERDLRERRKNVHAVVRGTVVSYEGDAGETSLEVTYNPYKSGTFCYVATGAPVYTAEKVCLHKGKVWVLA